MKHFDLFIMISSMACLFVLYAVVLCRPYNNVSMVEPVKEITDYSPLVFPLPKIERREVKEEYTAMMEEFSEYTAVMYATVPIGKYYLTGYNHEETGSKMTASGKTCHEGTITTCAADPRYHKFGEYLEINGRLYVVEDTGSAVKKKHIDLYFAKYSDMCKFGSHYAEIYRVEFPFGKPGQK